MIQRFKSHETELLFNGTQSSEYPPEIQNAARRKLRQIDAALTIIDLKEPPGNRLEKLSGDREGHYSILINDQWRVCFRWEENRATEVEIVDYHWG
jgi:proteic killer suppression protein